MSFDRDEFGADERSRTSDLLITNQLLYQLSYISQDSKFSKSKIHPTIPARWALKSRPDLMETSDPFDLTLRAEEYRNALM